MDSRTNSKCIHRQVRPFQTGNPWLGAARNDSGVNRSLICAQATENFSQSVIRTNYSPYSRPCPQTLLRLKRLRNYRKMTVIPGSSMVEHSLASVNSFGAIPKHLFLVPQDVPTIACWSTMHRYKSAHSFFESDDPV